MNDQFLNTQQSSRPDIEQSRRALISFLSDQQAGHSGRSDFRGLHSNRSQPADGGEADDGIQWARLAEAGLASWWQDHPVRAGLRVAKAATEDAARRKPLQVVALAAAAGAVLVVTRPWRLLSTSAIALSLLRSTNFASIAASLIETATQPTQKDINEIKKRKAP